MTVSCCLVYIYIYIYIKEIIKKRTKWIFHNILVLTFSLLLQIFRYIYIYKDYRLNPAK